MKNEPRCHPVSRTILVNGMSCSTCEQKISKELGVLSGVSTVKPDHRKGVISVTYDLHKTSLQPVEEKLLQLGYRLDNSFWGRMKRNLAHFKEQNEYSSITHKSACCNKPPVGG